MSFQWNIDKLMVWRMNNWIKCDSKSDTFTLRVHFDQLMIMSATKILETFNMNTKMKGIYKESIMILIIGVTGQEIRKLKFQIKSDVAQCLCKLGEHFPVVNYKNSLQSRNTVPFKYLSLDTVMKRALENNGSAMSVSLPVDYGNFIKLCLLDPAFPQTVLETNKIIQEEILKTQ